MVKKNFMEEAGDSMHNYLRAIGFSTIKNRTDLDRLVDKILHQAEEKQSIELEDGIIFTELRWACNESMGLSVRGEYDNQGVFHMEHYFPYYISEAVSTNDIIMISKRVDTDAYTGMCDDYRLGVSLIFYLQNSIEFLRAKEQKKIASSLHTIRLAALSVEGKVLLPINQSIMSEKYKTLDAKYRNQLIAEAKKGNQEAIDSLTIDDIDLYAQVSRRIKDEDLYSIVDTSFIPYGSESDNYSIIGTIQSYKLVENKHTSEQIYELEINCNDLMFQVCINQLDLEGEPGVGRRFKGNIWMQGAIQFQE